MNKNIDLIKILKDCPKGTKLYSILYGEVEFISVNPKNDSCQIVLKELRRNSITFVDSKGKYFHECNGECTLFPSKDQRDWSKFTAPWYKKDKLVEPKFKVGDWIISSVLGTACIMYVNDSNEYQLEYISGEQKFSSIDYVNYAYDKWTIKDAKDGDVLANDHHILILKELVYDLFSNGTPYSVKAYCGIKSNGNFEISKDNWSFCGTLHIHPATKEQRDTLMKAINDTGYEWDMKKKELNKKEKFNPKTLKPFDKVLMRDFSWETWNCQFFSHISNTKHPYAGVCSIYKMCIPYNDETKHLVGTNEEAPEYYKYWEN